MKFYSPKFFFFLSVAFLCASCLDTTTTSEVSSDASFVSLTFAENDSIPYLEDAVFTLESNNIITNLDSLPYGTRIDSVFPTFSFNSCYAAYYKKNGENYYLTGTDTLDFSNPVEITNIPSNGNAQNAITYIVKVNVHKVKPELYVWQKVTNDIYSGKISSQKAIVLNDKVLYFVNNSSNTTLYNLNDGSGLDGGTVVSGLPADVSLQDMVEFNGKIYLTQNGSDLYSSADGLTWIHAPIENYTFKSLLFVLNNELWVVVQASDSKTYFGTSTDAVNWVIKEMPSGFPVTDFAATAFVSRVGTPKAIVIGGKDAQNNLLKNRWSTEDGSVWVNFSVTNHSLDFLVDRASVIFYDDKLLLFGQSSKKDTINHYRVSLDEGFSWNRLDTVKLNALPDSCNGRKNMSVVVYKPWRVSGNRPEGDKTRLIESNRIYFIGGERRDTIFSDVWTGKLNRKSFLRQ